MNTQNKEGITPLVVASYNHQNDAVKLLLGSGAVVNMPMQAEGDTPDVAEYLVTAGARLEQSERK